MRVTTVGLYSNETEVATFSLREPDPTNQYMVKQMVGLDADEIITKFYGIGTLSGDKYYDVHTNSREIVIRLVLNPRYVLGESVSNIRDELYRAISANRTGEIALRFNSGGATVATISGFISKFEAGLFSKTPEVQITIQCSDGMLRGFAPVTLDNAEMATTNPVAITDSLSTSPHGFEMCITYTVAETEFLIRKAEDDDWSFEIIPGIINVGDGLTGFQIADKLTFNSRASNRALYVTRGGTDYPILDKVVLDSIWPIIFPGTNEFYMTNLSSFTWDYVSFYPAYWGV
jgi:hypothetical protein